MVNVAAATVAAAFKVSTHVGSLVVVYRVRRNSETTRTVGALDSDMCFEDTHQQERVQPAAEEPTIAALLPLTCVSIFMHFNPPRGPQSNLEHI